MPETSVEELWLRWSRDRDPQARERLVAQYAPLVKYVVGRLRSRLPAHVDADDLTSEGLLGLLDAMDRFDLSKGLQFQTFALPRIRGAILDGLRASDWLPRSARDRLRAVDRAEDDLAQQLGRAPTPDEVATELATNRAEVRRAAEDRAKTSAAPLEEHLEDPPAALVEQSLEADEPPTELAEAIRGLPERDQVVLALYYWERLTLAEVGHVLGVTESRVSQLHSRATRRLQDALREQQSLA